MKNGEGSGPILEKEERGTEAGEKNEGKGEMGEQRVERGREERKGRGREER